MAGLLLAPIAPTLIAQTFVYPFHECDASMNAGNFYNPQNEEICGDWAKLSFSFGWLAMITWPVFFVILCLHLCARLAYAAKSKKPNAP